MYVSIIVSASTRQLLLLSQKAEAEVLGRVSLGCCLLNEMFNTRGDTAGICNHTMVFLLLCKPLGSAMAWLLLFSLDSQISQGPSLLEVGFPALAGSLCLGCELPHLPGPQVHSSPCPEFQIHLLPLSGVPESCMQMPGWNSSTSLSSLFPGSQEPRILLAELKKRRTGSLLPLPSIQVCQSRSCKGSSG